MKTLILFGFLVLPLFPLCQINITQEDMEEIYTIGDTAYIYHNYSPYSSVDIGHPGGNNGWQFEDWMLWASYDSPNYTEIIYNPDSIWNPDSILIPESDFAIFRGNDVPFLPGILYQLDTSFRAISYVVYSFGPPVFHISYLYPYRLEYKLPIEYLEFWESNYELINSEDSVIATVHIDYEVDAYGIMKSPFDEVFDALRIKESYYKDSILTQVSFKLLSENGAMYELIKENLNDPDSGLIYLEYASYKTPFFSGNPNSIEEIQNVLKISCNPNPITSVSSINITLEQTCHVQISLHSIRGERLVLISEKLMQQGPNSINFNPQEYDLSTGVYLLKVSTDQSSRSLKVLVQ